ncbi:MAG: dihydrodipicolinate synthase family protein [Acidobacteriia bacterium]|nr:dihydrodipicolinate synthase family protein [Terriglobia bacterium]
MSAPRTLHIDGIVPIIPTPFQSDESIDFAGFAPLVDFAVAGGCSAICLPAYASEFYKLSEEERIGVVQHAMTAAHGRIPVIGQANHPAARLAAKAARALEAAGVDAIAVAVPRLFGLPEKDIFRYFDTILSAIQVPLLIQDFNPGGPTVSPQFVADLNRLHPHFRYIKLEEPVMAAKVKAMVDATSGEVGVLEGWGGMYMLELIDAGICGVMPGLAVSDLLVQVYQLARSGRKPAAYEIFADVLPQIVFSLQNMEFYHYAEKRLLAMRGILRETAVRDLTMTPDEIDRAHVDFLDHRILALLDRLNMPHHPPLPIQTV